MDIDKILDGVLSKFKTRDPFEIADMAGILVFFEELEPCAAITMHRTA